MSSSAGQRLFRLFPSLDHPVAWARFGQISRFIAHTVRPVSPPVLVLSVPRSGSSWVGDTLGAAQNALYLREPIVRTHLKHAGPPSFFEVDPANPPPAYRQAGDAAFAGLPTFRPSIVKYSEQWRLGDRRQRRLVIKETNPLALSWLVQEYRPKIVYLVRHPAAVANSFLANGWKSQRFEDRFLPGSIPPEEVERFSSFWAGHGALQATVLKRTLDLLDNYPDYTILRYEDLCLDPVEEFRRLFDFCALTWDVQTEARIRERAVSKGSYQAGNFDLKRDSLAMITKWQTQIDPSYIDEIREAYLSYDPPFYGPETWRTDGGTALLPDQKA